MKRIMLVIKAEDDELTMVVAAPGIANPMPDVMDALLGLAASSAHSLQMPLDTFLRGAEFHYETEEPIEPIQA